MGQRRAGHSKRCLNCRLNLSLCVCHLLRPLSITTNISLIVHVRELKLTSNTAQFAQKMLPFNAQTFIRGRVHETFSPHKLLGRGGRKLFLYPHEDAVELGEDFKEKFPGPYHLIIPDGNWQQARKVRQRESGLKDLMAVKLPAGIKARYHLRRAQYEEWVSTYEAMAHALGILESQEIRNELLEFFSIWVQRTQMARRGEQHLVRES